MYERARDQGQLDCTFFRTRGYEPYSSAILLGEWTGGLFFSKLLSSLALSRLERERRARGRYSLQVVTSLKLKLELSK